MEAQPHSACCFGYRSLGSGGGGLWPRGPSRTSGFHSSSLSPSSPSVPRTQKSCRTSRHRLSIPAPSSHSPALSQEGESPRGCCLQLTVRNGAHDLQEPRGGGGWALRPRHSVEEKVGPRRSGTHAALGLEVSGVMAATLKKKGNNKAFFLNF